MSAEEGAVLRLSFIGAAGIPNRYGGFESFLENIGPEIARRGHTVFVSCDSSIYSDQEPNYKDVFRVFVSIKANGWTSVLHDLFAFITLFSRSSHLIVLGVSGGIWFPFFRFLCDLFNKNLVVNIDGVEWRRSKFGAFQRVFLRLSDYLAQRFAHRIVYDNEALHKFIIPGREGKAVYIPYSGDHVIRIKEVIQQHKSALTICRIEPENNIEMLISGFLRSNFELYTVVGNWNASPYARALKERFLGEKRLRLACPTYDPFEVGRLRESCGTYIHGHSVGGTNPSLVEMLYYDCRILCFDVIFNRETAGDSVQYFENANALSIQLSSVDNRHMERSAMRERYTAKAICNAYIDLFLSMK